MSIFEYHAKAVAWAHPDGECHLVGFADEQRETNVYALLQRSFEFDKQDTEQGIDTYHFEWCGQEHSGYGGIAEFKLGKDWAEIVLDENGAEVLDGIETIRLTFQISQEEHKKLECALRAIFSGLDSGIFAAV